MELGWKYLQPTERVFEGPTKAEMEIGAEYAVIETTSAPAAPAAK